MDETTVLNEGTYKVKILFVIGTLYNGGAERALLNIVKALDQSKFDITVQTIIDEGELISEIKNYATYKTIYKTKVANQEEYLEVIKRHEYLSSLSAENFSKAVINDIYDIEVAFLEDVSTKLIAYSPNQNSRKIAWIHNDFLLNTDSLQYFDNFEQQRECYFKFNDIVCVSNKAKEAFIQRFGRLDGVHVFYNIIDRDDIIRKSCESVLMTISSKFKICTVGRLVPQKGFDRLLEVHNRLIQEGFVYELWIIGEGHQRKELEFIIHEYHLENSVRLLGQQSNPYNIMKNCDLFVCSSRFEGLGLVVAEAVILGLPVVCTDCAAKELIEEADTGLIVDNSVDGLYQGIKQMLINTPDFYSYKKKSIQEGKRFYLKKQKKELEDFLYQTLKRENQVMGDYKITVFTPTFNRAYIIEKLYDSLKQQTCKDFEWIVIDDGSSDNTAILFDKWCLEDNGFDIIYLKVKNGGKHRAINKGTEMARGKLFFIVDSDDYLLNNAIEQIISWESTIENLEGFAGVSGNRGYSEEQIIGETFNGDFIDATNLERGKFRIFGDKAEVYYTEILRKYKFPEIEGENFMTENVVWNAIANDGYKIRWFNQITYICHYLTDGLTYHSGEIAVKNPKGYALANKRNQMFYQNYMNNEKKKVFNQVKEYLIQGDLEKAEQVMNLSEVVLANDEEFILLKHQLYLYAGKLKEAQAYLEASKE